MPRTASVDRPVPLTVHIPESVMAPLILHLWSPIENRVPKGGYQAFFVERIGEYFSWDQLDLAPYGFPPGSFLRGPKDSCDAFRRMLDSIYPDLESGWQK